MDGLDGDADVIFVLTTNRPELLEPALAQRPGRIDQAVEIALPDAACRRRLFDRYFRDVALGDVDLKPFVERTDGVTASFVKELARRPTLAALRDGRETVGATHVTGALDDLLVRGSDLLRRSLGAERPDPTLPATVVFSDDGNG